MFGNLRSLLAGVVPEIEIFKIGKLSGIVWGILLMPVIGRSKRE